MKRSLSPKVVSRWYRSPELILSNHYYDQSVDIWSLGCVLAEMILSSKSYRGRYDRKVLFQGEACAPLSPTESDTGLADSSGDQLAKILNVLQIGEEDTSFITDGD